MNEKHKVYSIFFPPSKMEEREREIRERERGVNFFHPCSPWSLQSTAHLPQVKMNTWVFSFIAESYMVSLKRKRNDIKSFQLTHSWKKRLGQIEWWGILYLNQNIYVTCASDISGWQRWDFSLVEWYYPSLFKININIYFLSLFALLRFAVVRSDPWKIWFSGPRRLDKRVDWLSEVVRYSSKEGMHLDWRIYVNSTLPKVNMRCSWPAL